MSELDDDERAYLAAFLEVHTPSEAAVRSSLARVQERLAAGEGVAVPDVDVDRDAAPSPAPARLRPLVLVGVTVVALAAAVALLWRLDVTTLIARETGESPAGAVYAGQESDGAQGEASDRVRPVGARRATAPSDLEPEPPTSALAEEPEVEAPAELPPESAPESVPESPVRSRPRARKPKPESSTEPGPEPAPAADATLHAELALLRPAQQALRAGDHARALRLFDDHAASFPRSVLAPERSLGRIQALCGLGRHDRARALIEAFGRTHPGSPLAGRVKQACPAATAEAP